MATIKPALIGDNPDRPHTAAPEAQAFALASSSQADQHPSFLASMVETAGDAIVGVSGDGTILVWNRGAEKLYGYTAGEACGHPVAMLAPADRQDELAGLVARLRRGECIEQYETTHVRKDGTCVHVALTLAPVVNGEGYVGASWIARSIPSRNEAVSLSRESDLRFRSLMQSANDAIVLADSGGHIIFWNAAAERIFGYREEELLGKSLSVIMPERYRAAHARGIERVSAGARSTLAGTLVELHGQRKDGAEFPLELSLASWIVDGEMFFSGTIRDITERRRAEHALRRRAASIELLQTVAVAANEATSVEQAIQVCLDQVCGYMGWPVGHAYMILEDGSDDLVSTLVWSLADPDRFARFKSVSEATRLPSGVGLPGRVAATGKPSWIVDVAVDSNFVRLEAARELDIKAAFAFPVLVGNEVVAVLEFFSLAAAVPPDDQLLGLMGSIGTQLGRVVERKRAETALRESEERFRQVTENIQEVVWMTNADRSQVFYASPTYEKVWGRPRADLYARPRAFLDAIHADDREHIIAVLERDGARSFNAEYRIVRPDGEVRWIWDRAFPINAQHGEVARMAGIAVDITERKQVEEALRVAEAARRANSAKDAFLSRMSHELRTPLNAILGFGQLLQMGAYEAHQEEGVDHILKAGRYLLALINEVLDIARIEAGKLLISLDPVPLDALVVDAVKLIEPLLGTHNLVLRTDMEAARGRHVLADEQRLKQILLNLLSNAVKYNRPGGTITIEVVEIPGKHLRLLVRDTGIGIPADKLQRLFEPFDRLGAEQTDVEGTGLGLALAQRLAEALGLHIALSSVPGQGSSFWIDLPLVEQVQPVPSRRRDDDLIVRAPRPKPTTVLYIEDNPSNFRLIEHILLQRPHIALLAAMQGGIGLDLAREHQPDLIFLDLNLPDMPGQRVLQRLQEDPRTASIPVIVVSADAMPEQIARLRYGGATAYLTKPLDVREFLAVVDQVLQSNANVGGDEVDTTAGTADDMPGVMLPG